MLCMTFYTIHVGMQAWMLLHLFPRPSVTRQTYRLCWGDAIQPDFHGSMGIMAGGAMLHAIVGGLLRRMALRTEGDHSGFSRWVIRMAGAAGDILGMRAPGAG